jgi:hypothetical protein
MCLTLSTVTTLPFRKSLRGGIAGYRRVQLPRNAGPLLEIDECHCKNQDSGPAKVKLFFFLIEHGQPSSAALWIHGLGARTLKEWSILVDRAQHSSFGFVGYLLQERGLILV